MIAAAEESPVETEELLEEAPAATEGHELNIVPDVDKSLVDRMINGVPEEDPLLEEDLDSIDDLGLDNVPTDVQQDIVEDDTEELTEPEEEETEEADEEELTEKEVPEEIEELSEDIEQLDDIEPLDCEVWKN